MKRITALKVLENYRVWLRFQRRIEGKVDFSQKPRTGVYGSWNSYANFRAARIGDGGELMGTAELDFCPDSLWLLVEYNAAKQRARVASETARIA